MIVHYFLCVYVWKWWKEKRNKNIMKGKLKCIYLVMNDYNNSIMHALERETISLSYSLISR